MAVATLKPCRRLLIACTRTVGFFSKCPHRRPSAADPYSLHRLLRPSDPEPARPRPRPGPCPGRKGFQGIPAGVSEFRRFSTSTEPLPGGGGGKAFDRIYIEGMAVKPLVLERVEAEALKEAVKEEVEQEEAATVEKEGLWGAEIGNLE